MGQEERKNKAKLEKTQIQLASNSKEYEAAVKTLEETTGRWNKEWKAACDVCDASLMDNLNGFNTNPLTEIPRLGRRAPRLYKEQPLDLCKHCLYRLRERRCSMSIANFF